MQINFRTWIESHLRCLLQGSHCVWELGVGDAAPLRQVLMNSKYFMVKLVILFFDVSQVYCLRETTDSVSLWHAYIFFHCPSQSRRRWSLSLCMPLLYQWKPKGMKYRKELSSAEQVNPYMLMSGFPTEGNCLFLLFVW